MVAPWGTVPLPSGRPLPSGPILMSQRARSASEICLPSPKVSAAIAAPAQVAKARNANDAIRLREDMLCLPLAVDRPAGNHIHVPHGCPGLSSLGDHFGAG